MSGIRSLVCLLFSCNAHQHTLIKPAVSTGRKCRRPRTVQPNALPSGPAVFAIAAPESIQDKVQEGLGEITSFSQQDYDKFVQGYKSQFKELSFWVEDDAIEGTFGSLGTASMHCVRLFLLLPLLAPTETLQCCSIAYRTSLRSWSCSWLQAPVLSTLANTSKMWPLVHCTYPFIATASRHTVCKQLCITLCVS